MFPNLFRLTAQKNARVADLWNWNSGEGGWNPIFLRSFNDWEMEEVNRFLQVLYSKQIRPLIEDKILFKGSRNEAYSVSSMYRELECFPHAAFPSRSIWNSVVRPGWDSSLGRRPGEKCLLWTSSNVGGELSLIVVSFVKRMRRT